MRLVLAAAMLCIPALSLAQQPGGVPAPVPQANQPAGGQPPPFIAPNPPTPAAAAAPGQQPVPAQASPDVPPNAPLPQPDASTIGLRNLAPLSTQPAVAQGPSSKLQHDATSTAAPQGDGPSYSRLRLFSVIGSYKPPRVPEIKLGSPLGLEGMVREGKLYLSLHDALELAIRNNLDVEVSRYNLLIADTDLLRAQGGGNTRGIDYTVQQTAPGVGSETGPLLVTSTTTANASPTSVNVTDLSQVTQAGTGQQQSLSENNTQTYSPGPNVPLFDPVLTGQAGYYRRSDQNSLLSTTGTTDAASTSAPEQFVGLAADYQQGFSFGTQVDAYVDNAAQVLYAGNSQLNPFHAPSSSVTITQPLLRGRGRSVNLRFLRIGQLDRKVSRLVFEQQLLETVYGVSRLYFDLVSLGENVGVKEEALAAAQKLYGDEKDQVDEGTLAPIELTRVQALLSSSRLDLIQAQGEYRQQEAILRDELVRTIGPAAGAITIVPIDRIVIPANAQNENIDSLIEDALKNRPDLAQAALQISAGDLAVKAARNEVKPQINLYANAQVRGAALTPYVALGSPGTDTTISPAGLTQGGLRLSTIYQGGIQLNMPLRNRIAQADAARDEIQLRQAQGRSAKLENEIREQVENSVIALDTAHQAYAAAVESRNYQQQLLQAEIDKFSVGESTNFLIIQDQAYLAQARSTEVAARSNWMKAKLSLDRALGSLLESNHIDFQEAVRDSR